MDQRLLRKIHLYLGCFFAPLLIFYSLSGAWQIFRLNDVPKTEPSRLNLILHEISKPHTHSTLPGQDTKTSHSEVFEILGVLMAVGLIVTAILGIQMGYKNPSTKKLALILAAAGCLVPILFLMIH